MNIQIAGITGMLGSAVSVAARKRGHAVTTTEDITRVEARSIVAPVVINCAGLVKQRQYPASRFMAVNAVGPHKLAEACDAVGARLIHVSTDCVCIDQIQVGPFSEHAGLDEYARSKLAGEVTRAPHLTIRTSFVGFGIRGLIAELQSGREIRASNRLLWSGHTVDTVADVLITLAERADISGLLHIPGEFQTRWKLCQKLKARFNLPSPILRDDAFVADRRLISTRWATLGLPDLPSFATQLETMEAPHV